VNLRSFSTLQLALGLSIAVHAAVLTVRLVDPQAFERVFQDTPLEVILVNSRTNEQPDKAAAIAQANMAGGGEAERGRATSPLPPTALSENGDSLEDEARRKVQSLQQQQTMLLALVKKQIARLRHADPAQPSMATDQIEREQKRRQLIKQLAEIERRINQDSERPRKRYISPSTREEAYALYYDRLRRAIEDKGTTNFPESKGKKLYGELTMAVTVNKDGSILETEIVESSGNRTLDRRAAAIARSAAPFGRFDKAMRREADQIVVVSRFRFTRDETLETSVSAR
jgi:protein TonB